MKCVCLNSKTVSCLDDVYHCFAVGFRFPDYFGKNLDALYDCLTESTEERTVIISDRAYLEETLGEPFSRLCLVLDDAAREVPSLSIREVI